MRIVGPEPAPSHGFSPRSVPNAPRARILNAAERLFMRDGLRQVGVEAIAELAGLERAEISWHFADSEDLANEVLRAIARRSVELRLASLRALMAEAEREGRDPALRDVIEVFCIPCLEPETGVLLAQLLVGHRVRPTPWSLAVIRDEFGDMTGTFLNALARAAPHLSVETLRWRFRFLLSNALLATIEPGMPRRLAGLAAFESLDPDAERMRGELIDFLVAAFGGDGETSARPPADRA